MAAQPDLVGRPVPAAPTRPAPATFIYAQVGSDNYWRAQAPAKALGAKLCAVPERLMKRAFTQPNTSTPLPWRIELTTAGGEEIAFSTMKAWRQFCRERGRFLPMSVRTVFPLVEGTAIWTRPDKARAALSVAMRDQGIRVLGESDDNYFADSTQNLFLRHTKVGEAERDHHARAMATMDGLVFSTEALRDIYYREMKKRLGKAAIPEMFVCRNCLPVSDWPERIEGSGIPRVGFMGSPSHVWDVNLVYGAFHAAHSNGAETVMIGYNPANPDPDVADAEETEDGYVTWRSAKSIEYKRKWGDVVDRHIRWVVPDEYHRAALPLDIGLCPLRTDSFTLGKSDVKMVELAISGAAGICQNMPVFSRAGWKHEVNCLMAGSPEEFGYAVLRLMEDEKLRYELVSAAQELVANERNERVMREEWGAALAG